MSRESSPGGELEALWRQLLSDPASHMHRKRRIMRILPSDPRCRICFMPFRGLGGRVLRLFERRPSNGNPTVCNVCERFAQEHPGGAEVDVAIIFADVRGSTSLAEEMGAAEFGRLIDRFYATASRVYIRNDGFIEKLVGDAATAVFLPSMTGSARARQAVDTGLELLAATGYPDDPWIPIGVGIHAGTAYVGAVGAREGRVEITALGDSMNVGARLAEHAGPGEIIASDEVLRLARIDATGLEARSLELKGKTGTMTGRVLGPADALGS